MAVLDRDTFFQRVKISIHTLHTEGDFAIIRAGYGMYISIHTLHTEGDL